MAKHDIAGGWVQLRDPKKVTERLRRPVQAAATAAQAQLQGATTADEVAATITPEALAQFNEFNDLLVVALVEAWSFEQPITVDGVLDLPGGAYDAVRELVSPMVADLMPSFEPSPDAESPTVPSNA